MLLSILLSASKPPTERSVKVESKIKSVTVFIQGAQVMREGQVLLAAGISTLEFSKLPAALKPGSIQVEGSGNFRVLSVSHAFDYLSGNAHSEEIIQLQELAENGGNKIKELQSQLAVYDEEEALLLENRKLGGKERGVEISQLKEAADFFRSRLSDIKGRKLALQQQIKLQQEEVSKVNNSLRDLKVRKKEPNSVVQVKVEALKAHKAVLNLSYLVEQAGWFPAYDLRVQEVGEPLSLSYKAQVFQQSGESWDQVSLTVSTGNPETNNNKPDLTTQWVNFPENIRRQQGRGMLTAQPSQIIGRVVSEGDGEPIPGVSIRVQGSTVGTVTNINGTYSLSIPKGSETLSFSFIGYVTQEIPVRQGEVIDVEMQEDIQALQEVVVTGYSDDRLQGRVAGVEVSRNARAKEKISKPDVARLQNQITTEFVITQPYDIPSDSKQYMVDMQQHDLEAFYQYYVAPELDKGAYLTAGLNEWQHIDILAGEASLFFEGKYVGKTLLDPQQTGDTLYVSLGKDKNVIVERNEVRDFSKKSFFGGKQKEDKVYVISLRNTKQKPVSMVLEDRVPVSRLSDITVEAGENSGAKYNSENGILRWELELQPGESIEKKFAYSLRYPAGRKIIFYER